MRGSSSMGTSRRAGYALGALSLVTLASAPLAAQKKPTGSISGIVRDDGGAPVANVEIIAVKHNIAARSDSIGKFFLTALPAGAIDLTFRRLAFEPVIVSIDLPPDDTTGVE